MLGAATTVKLTPLLATPDTVTIYVPRLSLRWAHWQLYFPRSNLWPSLFSH